MDSMNGKTCLVTGANSGIGKATALGLSKLGAHVILLCRDQAKGEEACRDIIEGSGNQAVDLMLADLSSQQSIREFATHFKARYQRLDVLLNNAGLYLSKRTLTVDHLETTFAVNHLAYFLLTNLLLDTVKASAPARIVNVASSAHASAIDFSNLQAERGYDGMEAYSLSKLANIIFTFELARRLEGTGITVNCLHPGVINSNLQRDMGPAFQVMARTLASPTKGAETSIYLASSPDVANVTGKYFDNKRQTRPPSIANDAAVARKLWDVSAQLTHLETTPAWPLASWSP